MFSSDKKLALLQHYHFKPDLNLQEDGTKADHSYALMRDLMTTLQAELSSHDETWNLSNRAALYGTSGKTWELVFCSNAMLK